MAVDEVQVSRHRSRPAAGCAGAPGSRFAPRGDQERALRLPRGGPAPGRPGSKRDELRVADAEVVDPDRGVDEDHAGVDRRRGGDRRLRVTACEPREPLGPLALIRATSPGRTSAPFSVPVSRWASRTRASSRASVVRMATSRHVEMHHMMNIHVRRGRSGDVPRRGPGREVRRWRCASPLRGRRPPARRCGRRPGRARSRCGSAGRWPPARAPGRPARGRRPCRRRSGGRRGRPWW